MTQKNTRKPNINIGLFGSSFNPPHLGHLSVLKDLLSKNNFDEIWLLPVFQHPFGKALLNYDQRVEMIKLLSKELSSPQIKLCEIEKELNKEKNYTFDTINALHERYSDHMFTMILGSDTKNDLPKWHRSNELQNLVNFHFVPRAGLEDSPYPNVSSTQIREALENGQSIANFTLPSIANYIENNKISFPTS